MSSSVHELAIEMANLKSFAVAGVSRNPQKYGTLAYRALVDHGKITYPINPSMDSIDGSRCFPDIESLPAVPDVLVSVVQPSITEQLVGDCARLGVPNIWMQPGAESDAAVQLAETLGIAVVHGGPCIMVLLATLQYQSGLK